MADIVISGAREANLRDLSVRIPKGKLVVLTGVSGSGKSTLAVDVLYQECQRQYLEAIGYQGVHKPKVDSVRGLTPAVRITQTQENRNPRSTVGTVTYIYTELRMIYEKLGVRTCPHCGRLISAADCREETEKKDGDFFVYRYCHLCGERFDALTRSHFSHNTREGACPTCQGLGRVMEICAENAVHGELSLQGGAVDLWGGGEYLSYQIKVLENGCRHYGLPPMGDKPIKDFTEGQRALLLYGAESEQMRAVVGDVKPPKTVAAGRFEGVYTSLWRRLGERDGNPKGLERYFDFMPCPDCHGERLNEVSRAVTVMDTRLPELSQLSLEGLLAWVERLERAVSEKERQQVNSYLLDLKTKLNRLNNVGLGYLTLDRQTATLSGGESQRIRLSAVLDSDLTGITYILDEPTTGLHPRDTVGLVRILKELRDLGNTVLVIEHDADVMREADHIIDIGPGAGRHGGEVVGQGTLEELKNQPSSVTGVWLKETPPPYGLHRRGPGEKVWVKNATLNNLKHIDVGFPTGCITAVTGVSGSGKSTLALDVLGSEGALARGGCNIVEGLGQFGRVTLIEQAAISRMRRSNVATYADLYTDIRKLFGEQGKTHGLTASHFSFNTPGGRCETCEGLGYVKSNLLFFDDIDVICPECGGRQFKDAVLAVEWNGRSIKDVLELDVEEALEVFKGQKTLHKKLALLNDVGLGYLELGQTLTTLSGGEGQRLKLARELMKGGSQNALYLMDEPTTGLHPRDVEHFLALLDRMADAGNTIIVVEHNQQVIRHADWVVDLGPDGGDKGGEVVFEGHPEDLKSCTLSETGKFL